MVSRSYDQSKTTDAGRHQADSGMTDKYAITKFKENFMPQAWKVDGY